MEALAVVRAASFLGDPSSAHDIGLRIQFGGLSSKLCPWVKGGKVLVLFTPKMHFSAKESAHAIAKSFKVEPLEAKTELLREDIEEIVESSVELIWKEIRRKGLEYKLVIIVSPILCGQIATRALRDSGVNRQSLPEPPPGGCLLIEGKEVFRFQEAH